MMVNQVLELAESRIADLKAKPFCELTCLPEYDTEEVTNGAEAVIVAVWKDVLDEHELRIVVQVYRRIPFGIRVLETSGFRISDSGELNTLTDSDIDEFN